MVVEEESVLERKLQRPRAAGQVIRPARAVRDAESAVELSSFISARPGCPPTVELFRHDRCLARAEGWGARPSRPGLCFHSVRGWPLNLWTSAPRTVQGRAGVGTRGQPITEVRSSVRSAGRGVRDGVYLAGEDGGGRGRAAGGD